MLADMVQVPTSLPANMSSWLADPLVRKIVYGAVAFIVLVLILRFLGRRREAARYARAKSDLRRGMEQIRMQREELAKLAERVVATSSTSRIAGFSIVRQVETVFSDATPSSVEAVEQAKALAVRKGANALVNLKSEQMPSGKWVASGDGVIVRSLEDRRKPADQ